MLNMVKREDPKPLEERIRWQEIGGCEEAKNELINLSIGIKLPSIYSEYGITPPKGIILHGPPGTGKTMLAKALATEVNCQCLSINLADIVTMWYGESEKNLQKAFDTAKKYSKEQGACIMYFDEIDAIAGKRGNDTSGVNRRIMSTFLTNLDGIESRSNIFLIGSTNDPEYLDEAFTRPGRIDRIIKIKLPNDKERADIFRIYIEKVTSGATTKYIGELDYEILSKLSRGMSGADIFEIVRRTCEVKMWGDLNATTNTINSLLLTEDFLLSIRNYDPSQGGSKHYARSIGFNN